MKYIISGEPIPLARPRFRKDGRAYDSQFGKKCFAKRELLLQHRNTPPLQGHLELTVDFYLSYPKATSKKSLIENKLHGKRPDLSNLVKFIEDICIPEIFHDDSIIASIKATKYYSKNPRTEFTLVPITQESPHEKETNHK